MKDQYQNSECSVMSGQWRVMSGELATRASASPNASPLSFHLSVIKKKLNEIVDATSGGNKSGYI